MTNAWDERTKGFPKTAAAAQAGTHFRWASCAPSSPLKGVQLPCARPDVSHPVSFATVAAASARDPWSTSEPMGCRGRARRNHTKARDEHEWRGPGQGIPNASTLLSRNHLHLNGEFRLRASRRRRSRAHRHKATGIGPRDRGGRSFPRSSHREGELHDAVRDRIDRTVGID